MQGLPDRLLTVQGVMAPNYELYKDERTKASYTIPFGTEIEVYRKAIEELPGQESPGIFGMHPNADLTFRSLQVQAGVQLILDTQPAGAKAAGGESKEEVVDKICEDLLGRVRLTFKSHVTPV
jgi:dynein heavy chain